jgi:hypothetical protein
MKWSILLTTVLLFASTRAACASDSGAELVKLSELTPAQQKNIDDFIREHERPEDELKQLADRSHITVKSSKVLRDLFPDYRFVLIPWIYQVATPEAAHKYSMPSPGAVVSELALSDDGKTHVELDSNGKEWGALLHAERVNVSTEAMAEKVAAVLFAHCYQGARCRNLHRGTSEWILGYRESEFRVISGYEEIREATYYRLTTDSNGIVINGQMMNDVLERRKIR